MSSKPSVVMRPMGGPDRVASTLVTAVVPRPKRLTRGMSSSMVVPDRSAARRQAASTPWPRSPLVVGDLARHTCSPSVSTASVNVPPTSMPMHTSGAVVVTGSATRSPDLSTLGPPARRGPPAVVLV